jgi:hypothetical protein
LGAGVLGAGELPYDPITPARYQTNSM